MAVAFSGGVDSTFLLYAAHEVLGEEAIAITSVSSLLPKRERREAMEFCQNMGIRLLIVESNELEVEGFSKNPKDRCYICKKDLFSRLIEMAGKNGANEVVEGSNVDDEGDYRPGLRAIGELGIKSPLREASFNKAEIREISKYFDLPTWDKPSFACLASRVPYGEQITEKKLEMIDLAEQKLYDLGFKQFRVRCHGGNDAPDGRLIGAIARIELSPDEIDRFMEKKIRTDVYETLKNIGFYYITLDIKGYRTGSLNEVLKQ